jgi:hypothetical protein
LSVSLCFAFRASWLAEADRLGLVLTAPTLRQYQNSSGRYTSA